MPSSRTASAPAAAGAGDARVLEASSRASRSAASPSTSATCGRCIWKSKKRSGSIVANCSARHAPREERAGQRGALAAVVPAAERADEDRPLELRPPLDPELVRLPHQAILLRPPEPAPRTTTVAAQTIAARVTWTSTSPERQVRAVLDLADRPSGRASSPSTTSARAEVPARAQRRARRSAERTRRRRRRSRARAARPPAGTFQMRGTPIEPECGPAAVASVPGDDQHRAARPRRAARAGGRASGTGSPRTPHASSATITPSASTTIESRKWRAARARGSAGSGP